LKAVYLTATQILLFHDMAVEEYGGLHGIRDHAALAATVALPQQRVFGKELYPSVFLKAAVYARNIIEAHPFLDGNKRSAMISMGTFLERNGYRLQAEKGEIVELALQVAKGEMELEDIATWLKSHTHKAK
jgi:death-on-curing protein